jgi:hypothetical protein
MSQQQNNLPALKEAQLQLALKAIKRDATLSERRAAAIYNVSRVTLSRQRARILLQSDCTPNLINLLKTEEDVIVQHTINLDAQGFAPQYASIKDIANSLLAERHCDPVSQN